MAQRYHYHMYPIIPYVLIDIWRETSPIRWEAKDSITIYSVTMANSSWKDDEKLKKDLDQYVRENLKRSEILDFVKRDFPGYAWSIVATLDRRLRHFEIRYIDYNTSV